MKVCVLYSGGKDSNLALLKVSKFLKVECLVTLIPQSENNYLFHFPNVNLVKLQAEALGIPLITDTCMDDEKSSIEALYRILVKAKKLYKIEGVVTGVIKSAYQASRIKKVCWDLGLWCFNPLWLKDEIQLLKEVLANNFEVIITRVAGYPLKKSLLGRKLDYNLLKFFERMKPFINPSGEGGEYETFVLDMPLFRKKIKIIEYEIIGEDYDATMIIKKAELVSK